MFGSASRSGSRSSSGCCRWAEKRRINYTTFVDLSQKPEVAEMIKKEIININKELPDFAHVKRFVNLHKDFDADDAELTRTRKLKRNVVEKSYHEIIESLYDMSKTSLSMEAAVTYRDGRSGIVKTEINLHSVE